MMALTCVTVGALSALVNPLVGPGDRIERPAQVIEVLTHESEGHFPAVTRPGRVSVRLLNGGSGAERLELVQLDRWRLLGDPFTLGPAAARTLEVSLERGEYALLRLDGTPGAPGLVRRVMVR